MNRIEKELHRVRIAMLDRTDPDYEKFWVAQQALAWAVDPESAAPPFAAIRGSEAERGDCLVQSHPL